MCLCRSNELAFIQLSNDVFIRSSTRSHFKSNCKVECLRLRGSSVHAKLGTCAKPISCRETTAKSFEPGRVTIFIFPSGGIDRLVSDSNPIECFRFLFNEKCIFQNEIPNEQFEPHLAVYALT